MRRRPQTLEMVGHRGTSHGYSFESQLQFPLSSPRVAATSAAQTSAVSGADVRPVVAHRRHSGGRSIDGSNAGRQLAACCKSRRGIGNRCGVVGRKAPLVEVPVKASDQTRSSCRLRRM